MSEPKEAKRQAIQPGRQIAKRRPKDAGRRVQNGLAVWREMRQDPNIRLALVLIKAPIYTLPWKIEADDAAVAEDLTKALEFLWRPLVRSSLTAVEYGFAPHEKIWGLDEEGKPTLKSLNDLEPWKCRVVLDDSSHKFLGFHYYPGGTLSPVNKVFIPAEKSFLFTHGKEYGSLYGTSRLAPCEKDWNLGGKARENFGEYLRRKGDPPIKGRAPAETRHDANGTEIDCMEEAQANLLALESGGVAVFPHETDDQGNQRWDAEYMKVPERGEEFLRALDYHDTRTFRGAMVMEAVATHNDVGAFAAIKQYTDTFMQLEDLLAQDMVEQVSKYVVEPLAVMRHGQKARMTAGALSEQVNERYVEIIKTMLSNRLTAASIVEAVDVAALTQGAGLPQPPEESNDDPDNDPGNPDGNTGRGERGASPRPVGRTPSDPVSLARGAVDPRDRIEGEALGDARSFYAWIMGEAKKKSRRPMAKSTGGSAKRGGRMSL